MMGNYYSLRLCSFFSLSQSLLQTNYAKQIGVLAFVLILVVLSTLPAYAIVGGQESLAGSQPWAVGLALSHVEDGFHAQFCGGSLIGAKWVLTAAHCTYDQAGMPFEPDKLDVLINRHQLDQEEGERIRVLRIIRHPSYKSQTFNADLALLQLTESSTGVPITAAAESTQLSIESATVFGWGISGDGTPLKVLHQVSLPLVEHDKCVELYRGYDRLVNDNMLCAGYSEGGKDACIGDSGGPLAAQDPKSGQWFQLGIVSWGEGCGGANAYGVYTNLASFDRWIGVQMRYYNRDR